MGNGLLKADSAKFDGFLNTLKREPWIGTRDWWPDFLFHFTDIKNAVSVLNSGFLYSRREAEKQNLIVEDSASSQIISHTDIALTDFVRFYFRPLTPTAYMNEGFRPAQKLYHDAHCPVPVYVLFDLANVITLKDTRFSAGSLARTEHSLLDSAEDFANLPFRDIYHSSGWGHQSRDRQDEIKNRRHAEVIYPTRISLSRLEYIVCRSQAEYETLHNLLSPSVWNQWKQKVAVSKFRKLFNSEWLFVKEVNSSQQYIEVGFNFPAQSRYNGPFSLRVDITDNISGVNGNFEKRYEDIVSELVEPRLVLDVSSLNSTNYTTRITIDGILAYLGQYAGDEIPF